jgi:hypothetical protein
MIPTEEDFLYLLAWFKLVQVLFYTIQVGIYPFELSQNVWGLGRKNFVRI